MAELKTEQIKEIKKERRNFSQTVDLIVNISNLDLKKPENRIRERIVLPHKVKDVKVCFILDALYTKGKALGENHKVLGKSDLELKKRDAKRIARDYDFFVIEAPIMPVAAKILGKYTGPRNKSLIPLPPNTKDLNAVISNLEKTVSLNIVKNPLIQVPIGKENMEDKKIMQNYKTVVDKVSELLEPKKGQIIYLHKRGEE